MVLGHSNVEAQLPIDDLLAEYDFQVAMEILVQLCVDRTLAEAIEQLAGIGHECGPAPIVGAETLVHGHLVQLVEALAPLLGNLFCPVESSIIDPFKHIFQPGQVFALAIAEHR